MTADPLAGRVRLGATVHFVGEQFDDDRNQVVLEVALALDIVPSARIVGDLSLVARAENVTNAAIQVAKDQNGVVEVGAPRTPWCGIIWKNARVPAGRGGQRGVRMIHPRTD